MVKTADGYSFNESAIISLANKYAETSNLAISKELSQTNAAIQGVEDRVKAWGVEIEILGEVQKVYEETGSKIIEKFKNKIKHYADVRVVDITITPEVRRTLMSMAD